MAPPHVPSARVDSFASTDNATENHDDSSALPGSPIASRKPTINIRSTLNKVLRWAIYEVAFGLLPLLISIGHAFLGNTKFDMYSVLGRGELVLVSAAILAAAIGDLLRDGLTQPFMNAKVCLVGVSILAIAVSAWFYTEAASVHPDSAVSTQPIIAASYLAAGAAFVLSMTCVVFGEVKR